tara:strand:+ start:399 stop:1055 length:657 start_codon:yes stop_codon:yes gene_type:complete
MKKSNFFWVGYSDLMTSLFFIMLVLYVVSFAILKSKQGDLQAAADQLKKIENIQLALEGLDENYFTFDRVNKRYKLQVMASFLSGSDKILDIPLPIRQELFRAGTVLYAKVKEVIDRNPSVDYLLIIEGNAQRSNQNWITIPNMGYKLSYGRALSLFNYWKSRGLDFKDLGSQCEIIIAGSGYFGYSRDNNEENNRKFSIQVTSKVGKLLNKKNNDEK